MKKVLLGMTVLIALASSVQAQDIRDREHKSIERSKRHQHRDAFENLQLTEEQKAQLKTFREENRRQVDELKKNDNLTVKDYKTRMETLRKDQREKFQSILTSEQKAQLEKNRTERAGRNKQRSAERFEKMKQTLGLTEDQSAKLKAGREAAHAKVQAIREDQTLDETAKKERIKTLMKDQRESFRSVLTTEQLKKWDELKKQRSSHKKKSV